MGTFELGAAALTCNPRMQPELYGKTQHNKLGNDYKSVCSDSSIILDVGLGVGWGGGGASSFSGKPEKSFLSSAHILEQLPVPCPIRGSGNLKSWTTVLLRASHGLRDAGVLAPARLLSAHQDRIDSTSRTSSAPDVRCRKKLFTLPGRTQQNQASCFNKCFESGTKRLAKNYDGGLGLPIPLTPLIWDGSWQVPGTVSERDEVWGKRCC